MPIYEYICDDCGQKKEFLQKMLDEPISECPNCQSQHFHKCLSAASVQTKNNVRPDVPACQATGQCNGCFRG